MDDAPHDAADLLKFVRGQHAGAPGMHAGCTTKLLVGRRCDDSVAPSEREVTLAKERLKRFAFVGLEESWDVSMCVFHRLYGRRVPALALSNVRPGHSTSARLAMQERDLAAAGFEDHADEAIYELGQQLLAGQINALFGANSTLLACLPHS